MRFCWIDIFGAFHALRRDFKHPRERKRDRQTENDQENNQSNDPIRNVEYRKDLRDSLRQRPAADEVSNGNFVNVAPLQLAEESLLIQRGIWCYTAPSGDVDWRGTHRLGGSQRGVPNESPSR